MKLSKQKRARGYITIEAAFILPVVFLVIGVLIVIILVMYQKALMSKTAHMAAQQGAEIWTDSRRNISNGAWNPSEPKDSLYYRFSDPDIAYGEITIGSKEMVQVFSGSGKSLQDKKLNQIRRLMVSEMKRGVMKPEKTVVGLAYSNGFLEKRIRAVVRQDFKIPFGKIKALFDGKDTISIEASAEAAVTEPEETLRNVDLIMGYAERIRDGTGLGEMVEKLKEKVVK